jgi:serine/threonine-protein kinase RsbW
MVRRVQTDNGIAVVTLAGDLDLYNSSKFREAVQTIWNDGVRKIAVDLNQLEYVDSSGIGVLLYLYTSSQKRNGHVLYANVNGSVRKVIKLTRLEGFLPIAPTLGEALTRLREIPDEPSSERRVGIIVDDKHRLQKTEGMYHKTFYIDFAQIRRLSNLIANEAPSEIQEINMLEQQISEIIKNGVKHGNHNDKAKALKVWFSFSTTHAHLVVEDEGEGFQELEAWNAFYQKKLDCYARHDFDEMMNYLSFRTDSSDESDGGNAMFAAVEYWNDGVVLNSARNRVAVRKTFR